MKDKLNAFKDDAETSYYRFYKNYSSLRKRDMYYYWQGMLGMYKINGSLYNKEGKLLSNFLLELYYKKKKLLFSKDYTYILK